VRAIRAAAPDYLTKTKLCDIFQSKEIGNNQRSMAYELEFQSPGRTLTDEEVNNAFADIVAALQRELKVVIRAG
jgi:phenylalanyl-tRNA synthetase beta chain